MKKIEKIQAGDPVLLVYPPGLDFIVAFVACLRAGVIAVPVYPPNPVRMKKDILMFSAVAMDCRAKVALTNSTYQHVKTMLAIKEKLSWRTGTAWPELDWVVTDSINAAKSSKDQNEEEDDDDNDEGRTGPAIVYIGIDVESERRHDFS